MKENIRITIPNSPDYIVIPRLTVAVVADRFGMDINQVERLKEAVANACRPCLSHGVGDERNLVIGIDVFEEGFEVMLIDRETTACVAGFCMPEAYEIP